MPKCLGCNERATVGAGCAVHGAIYQRVATELKRPEKPKRIVKAKAPAKPTEPLRRSAAPPDTAERIARLIHAHDGATRAQIAQELDLAPSTVTRRVRPALAAGWVLFVRGAREYKVGPVAPPNAG